MAKLAINGGTPVRTEPFAVWPQYTEEEAQAAADVVRGGWLVAHHGGHKHVEAFQEAYAEYHGAAHAVATSSGTTALHVALMAAGIGPADEVIVPPMTFLATATSVVMANAIPVFADIEPQTLGLDPEAVRAKLTPRTKAVIVVHLNGFPADMDGLMAVARERDLIVLEDCAHAHGAEHNGRKVGTIGDLGCFSFQHKKLLSLGDGGMVTTNSDELAERAAGLRTFSGQPLSFNLRMTEIHAAIGKIRLGRLDAENEQRRRNAAYLDERLGELPAITPQQPRENTTVAYYNYVLHYNKDEFGVSHEKFQEALIAEGLPMAYGYFPLQRHVTFQTRDAYGHGCPFKCPFYTEITPPEQRPVYDEADTPVTVDMYENVVVGFTIHPPNGEAEMKDIADIFEKVITNIDDLR